MVLSNNTAYHWSYTAEGVDATTDPFLASGGYWGMDFVATDWAGGSITLEKLAGDGATWLPAMDPWTANGTDQALLPPGTYRLALAGEIAGAYVQLARIRVST